MDSIVYNNVLPWRGCEKLYLKGRTSDVHFIFRSKENDGIEKVPAHKSILSASSPVFDALFYGPNKQEGDIDIVDASPKAFKEFLQFFYRSQVKLTAENVSEVMNLGRQYLLDDWQMVANACTDLCVSALTLDNMCSGYELAILFELDELKKHCETQIGKNAPAIFRSDGFMNCQPNLLRHILQLDSFECDESIVFDGCMAWARAECMRKRCDKNNPQNLRAQLGELFYEIRFGELTNRNFLHRYQLYDGLFSLEEFRDITMMINRKDFQPERFNRSSRNRTQNESPQAEEKIIACGRKLLGYGDRDSVSTTRFISTSMLHLKKITLYQYDSALVDIEAKVRIYEGCTEKSRGILVSFVQGSMSKISNSQLPVKMFIEPGMMYGIDVELNGNARMGKFRNSTRLEGGAVIDFFELTNGSFVKGLHVVEYDKHCCNKL